MSRIGELTDAQATAFGHALLRWLTDEDPAAVARFFPDLDPHQVDDRAAADVGRAVLEDVVADLEGEPESDPPLPPHVAVRRSVRTVGSGSAEILTDRFGTGPRRDAGKGTDPERS
jgi:cobalamin biosynthesis Mg chelatase CobN